MICFLFLALLVPHIYATCLSNQNADADSVIFSALDSFPFGQTFVPDSDATLQSFTFSRADSALISGIAFLYSGAVSNVGGTALDSVTFTQIGGANVTISFSSPSITFGQTYTILIQCTLGISSYKLSQNNILGGFVRNNALNTTRDMTSSICYTVTNPSRTPSPSSSISPSSTPSSSPSGSPSTSPSTSASSSPSPSTSPSVSSSPSPSSGASPSSSGSPSASVVPSSSASPSASVLPSSSGTPSVSPSGASLPSSSSSPSSSSIPSSSISPSRTPSQVPSSSVTPSSSHIPTPSTSPSSSPSSSHSPSSIPSHSVTPSPSKQPSHSPSSQPSPSSSPNALFEDDYSSDNGATVVDIPTVIASSILAMLVLNF